MKAIEHAMLEVLNRPRSSEDVTRREAQLRALFVALEPDEAHDLVRRFDTGDDPLASALRRFIRRRR